MSEAEPDGGLKHMIGVYNVVWATTAAIGNFCGGAILDHAGLKSLFYVPFAIVLTQLGLTLWLERLARPRPVRVPKAAEEESGGIVRGSERETGAYPGTVQG